MWVNAPKKVPKSCFVNIDEFENKRMLWNQSYGNLIISSVGDLRVETNK